MKIAKFNKACKVNRQPRNENCLGAFLGAFECAIDCGDCAISDFVCGYFTGRGSLLSAGGFVAMIAAMLALLKPMKRNYTMQINWYRGLAVRKTVFEIIRSAAGRRSRH